MLNNTSSHTTKTTTTTGIGIPIVIILSNTLLSNTNYENILVDEASTHHHRNRNPYRSISKKVTKPGGEDNNKHENRIER